VTVPPDRAARRRRRRRRRLPGWVILLAGLVVTFLVGLAVGESIHDNPQPGGTQTLVRTLQPLTVAPTAATTVTVTVRTP
jgi:drug/metabolite transporter (DMT)-like permease